MRIATITLDYDGGKWRTKLQIDPAAHVVGISAHRKFAIAHGPGDRLLDRAGLDWIHADLDDMANYLCDVICSDCLAEAAEIPFELWTYTDGNGAELER